MLNVLLTYDLVGASSDGYDKADKALMRLNLRLNHQGHRLPYTAAVGMTDMRATEVRDVVLRALQREGLLVSRLVVMVGDDLIAWSLQPQSAVHAR